MGTAERRNEILKALCRRRHDTISNLAFEFGVSERTIRRDIETLSLSVPIYTQTGRYGGGIYVLDGYFMDQIRVNDHEAQVLNKINTMAEKQTKCVLSSEEFKTLNKLIAKCAWASKGNKDYEKK